MRKEPPTCLSMYPFPEHEYREGGWDYWTYTDQGRTEHFAIRKNDCRTLDVTGRIQTIPREYFAAMAALDFPTRASLRDIPLCPGGLSALDTMTIAALYGARMIEKEKDMPHDEIEKRARDWDDFTEWTQEAVNDSVNRILIWVCVCLCAVAGWMLAMALNHMSLLTWGAGQ